MCAYPLYVETLLECLLYCMCLFLGIFLSQGLPPVRDISKVMALAEKVEIPTFQPKKLQIEALEENKAGGDGANQAANNKNTTFSGLSLSGGGGDDEARIAILEQQLLGTSQSSSPYLSPSSSVFNLSVFSASTFFSLSISLVSCLSSTM